MSSSGRGEVISNSIFLGDGDCNAFFSRNSKLSTKLLPTFSALTVELLQLFYTWYDTSVSFFFLPDWILSSPLLTYLLLIYILNWSLHSCSDKYNLFKVHFPITNTFGKLENFFFTFFSELILVFTTSAASLVILITFLPV